MSLRSTISIQPFSTLALVFTLICTAGCSRENKIYSDPTGQSDRSAITVDGRSILPNSFFNLSVNRALADSAIIRTTADNGASSEMKVLRLQTLAGENPVGGFNGPGVGNRSLLGVAAYDGVPLSDLGKISFDSRSLAGNERIKILLQIDLLCNGSSPRVLVATPLPEPSTLTTPNFERFSAEQSTGIWQAVGPAIADPSAPGTDLLPSDSSNETRSLTALLQTHPDACVINASTDAADLPRAMPTTGVLLALGSSSTTEINVVLIDRLSIGGDLYEKWD